MRKILFALIVISACARAAKAWTHELMTPPVVALAASGDYMLLQLPPDYKMSGMVLGDRCPGGWMYLTSKAAFDLVTIPSTSVLYSNYLKRVIFSSTDVGIPIQGNPGMKTWCRVDWIER